jgi:hypothetical protein
MQTALSAHRNRYNTPAHTAYMDIYYIHTFRMPKRGDRAFDAQKTVSLTTPIRTHTAYIDVYYIHTFRMHKAWRQTF